MSTWELAGKSRPETENQEEKQGVHKWPSKLAVGPGSWVWDMQAPLLLPMSSHGKTCVPMFCTVGDRDGVVIIES